MTVLTYSSDTQTTKQHPNCLSYRPWEAWHFWACLHCSGTHAEPLGQECPPLLWVVAALGQEHTYKARGRLIKREEESLSFLCPSCSTVRKRSILDSFLPESLIAGLRFRFRKPSLHHFLSSLVSMSFPLSSFSLLCSSFLSPPHCFLSPAIGLIPLSL